MTGAKRNYNSTQEVVDKYLSVNNIYKPKAIPKFDMRGYARYIREHNLKASDITPEIFAMFSK